MFLCETSVGRDTVADFEVNVDTIILGRELLNQSTSTAAQVIENSAVELEGAILLDFGTDELLIDGLSNPDVLIGSIQFHIG